MTAVIVTKSPTFLAASPPLPSSWAALSPQAPRARQVQRCSLAPPAGPRRASLPTPAYRSSSPWRPPPAPAASSKSPLASPGVPPGSGWVRRPSAPRLPPRRGNSAPGRGEGWPVVGGGARQSLGPGPAPTHPSSDVARSCLHLRVPSVPPTVAPCKGWTPERQGSPSWDQCAAPTWMQTPGRQASVRSCTRCP